MMHSRIPTVHESFHLGVVGWLVSWLAGLVSCLVVSFFGWYVGWLVGWLVSGCSFFCLVGWLIGCLFLWSSVLYPLVSHFSSYNPLLSPSSGFILPLPPWLLSSSSSPSLSSSSSSSSLSAPSS